MTDNPYERFSKAELILRDQLAIDRTALANERTLLAYARGAMTLVIAGLSFVQFVPFGVLHVAGYFSIPLGILTGLYGLKRFVRMRNMIRSARRGAS